MLASRRATLTTRSMAISPSADDVLWARRAGVRRRFGAVEEASDRVAPEIEDATQRSLDEENVCPRPDRAERQGIVDDVVHARGLALGLELVGVAPDGIGARFLLVDEAHARLPFAYSGAPPERESEQRERVLYARACSHPDRRRREDAKTKERRGDRLQVRRVGEERKDGLPGPRHALGPLQAMKTFHGRFDISLERRSCPSTGEDCERPRGSAFGLDASQRDETQSFRAVRL